MNHQQFAPEDFERDRVLLHIAASRPTNAAVIAQRMGLLQATVQEVLTRLIDTGAVFVHQGLLHARAAASITAAAAAEELREVFDQALSEFATGPASATAQLVALTEAGCTDEPLLMLLVTVVAEHPRDAVSLGALKTVARARSLSAAELNLLLAHAALMRGDTRRVLALTEPLIEHSEEAIATQATCTAARAHLYENRFAHAETLHTHLASSHLSSPEAAESRLGIDAAWAVVVAVGTGNLAQARRLRATLADTPLTSEVAGLVDFADGLLASVSHNGEGALDLLARSANTLAPLGRTIVLPESPAAIAALVALGTGEAYRTEIVDDGWAFHPRPAHPLRSHRPSSELSAVS